MLAAAKCVGVVGSIVVVDRRARRIAPDQRVVVVVPGIDPFPKKFSPEIRLSLKKLLTVSLVFQKRKRGVLLLTF